MFSIICNALNFSHKSKDKVRKLRGMPEDPGVDLPQRAHQVEDKEGEPARDERAHYQT